jgi:hypothetical protein
MESMHMHNLFMYRPDSCNKVLVAERERERESKRSEYDDNPSTVCLKINGPKINAYNDGITKNCSTLQRRRITG